MRPLSNRLQAIFDLVPTSAKVCDVGTDHAYLPIALSKSQKAKTIIACDVNESPLKKARENLDKAKVKNVDLRLSDGLSKVSENEADTVIIAGMGGDVICHILSSCPWIKNEKVLLLLQPMTSAELLRSFLTDNLFEIEKEVPLTDSSKLYSVIVARFSGKRKVYKKGYEFIGEVRAETTDGKLYIEKQRKRIENHLKSIKNLLEKRIEAENLSEILNYIENILEN